MERPNTISGLVAKRAQLLRIRKGLETELRTVTCDLDHLEAAIRLFDPAQTPAARKRYAVQHRAQRGHVKRFVLDALREATEPVTSRELAERWIAARGLRADDATVVLIRKRIGAVLTSMKAAGLAEPVGIAGSYSLWRLAPCRLRRSRASVAPRTEHGPRGVRTPHEAA